MIILGLATMGTSAACLMRDGGIVAAIEEERLSRIKNDGAFPLRAVAECLRVAGVTMAEVDAVAVYWKRWRIGTRAAGTLGKAIASPAARSAIAARTRRALIGGPGIEIPPRGYRPLVRPLPRPPHPSGRIRRLPRRRHVPRPPPDAPDLRRGDARLADLPVALL